MSYITPELAEFLDNISHLINLSKKPGQDLSDDVTDYVL